MNSWPRASLIKDFTGIGDSYEEPEKPEVCIDIREISPDEAADRILFRLEAMDFIRNP